MKRIALSFAVALTLLFSSCKNEEKKGLSTDLVSDKDLPVITFAETEHDFGTIIAGEVVEHTFEFTNTGKGPLVISEAVTSCGCTVPDYPREPIQPGEKSKIQVKFNSEGKMGFEKKSVTIIANTKPNNNNLYITANVVKPK